MICRKCPKFEAVACRKIKEVVKDLQWRLKLYSEWEEMKAKKEALIRSLEAATAMEKLKIHYEIEQVKHHIRSCEAHLKLELEELKETVESIAAELNPIEKIKAGFLKFKAHFE
jgi:predicted RNase H-like nuclease (RuvC/YqgF family)